MSNSTTSGGQVYNSANEPTPLAGGQVFITGGTAEGVPPGANVVFVNPTGFALPQIGLFAGMTNAQLTAALATAQQAYLDISSGAKVVTISYAQGDGSKTVTYQQSGLANLTQLIRQLQQALGLICQGRRAGRPIFR